MAHQNRRNDTGQMDVSHLTKALTFQGNSVKSLLD